MRRPGVQWLYVCNQCMNIKYFIHTPTHTHTCMCTHACTHTLQPLFLFYLMPRLTFNIHKCHIMQLCMSVSAIETHACDETHTHYFYEACMLYMVISIKSILQVIRKPYLMQTLRLTTLPFTNLLYICRKCFQYMCLVWAKTPHISLHYTAVSLFQRTFDF